MRTLLGRAGFSPVAADRGAFSLPASTTRCWEEKREDGVFGSHGEFSPKSAPMIFRYTFPRKLRVEFTSRTRCTNAACSPENRNAGRMNGAMPTSIDWPLKNPQRRRRRFFILLAVLAVIVFGGRTAVSYFVDLLWFRSLGYGSVFTKTLALRVEHLRALCGGHLPHPVRIVCRSEAGASARFAQQPHDFLWGTAGEAPGRACDAPARFRRIARSLPW